MANPTLENNTLARRKPIGEALGTKDTLLPTLPTVIHNSTPPTLADGDVAPLQCDDAGSVNVTLPDPAVIASLQLAKGEYNVTPPSLTDGQTDALQLRSNGDLKTYIQNPTIEQTTGAAHNTLNLAVAGKDTSGNVQPISTDTLGKPQVTLADLNVSLMQILRALNRPINMDVTTGKTRVLASTDTLLSVYYMSYWLPPSTTGLYSISSTSGYDWTRTSWNQNIRTRIT